MDFSASVDVNCGRRDGLTENRTPISHLAKAGVTKMMNVGGSGGGGGWAGGRQQFVSGA